MCLVEHPVGYVLDTSREQPSAVLKAMTRPGLSYCPEMKLRMIVSRSAFAASVPR